MPTLTVPNRAETLRGTLTPELLAEFLPADVASAASGSVFDFCAWVQFSQWHN